MVRASVMVSELDKGFVVEYWSDGMSDEIYAKDLKTVIEGLTDFFT